jgi:hypothetical protein
VLAVVEPYRRAVGYARQLSVGVDYARFDFLWNGQDLFGGEITVYPAGGMRDPANSVTRDVLLGGWDLLQSHFLKSPQAGWTRRYAEALKQELNRRVCLSPPTSAVRACPASAPQTHLANDHAKTRRPDLTGRPD